MLNGGILLLSDKDIKRGIIRGDIIISPLSNCAIDGCNITFVVSCSILETYKIVFWDIATPRGKV